MMFQNCTPFPLTLRIFANVPIAVSTSALSLSAESELESSDWTIGLDE
jgi:hypothetical protein